MLSGGFMARTKSQASAGTLGGLVRDELSAVETYRQALDKVGEQGASGQELRGIETEHEEFAGLLRERMTQLGLEAPENSGLWGAWAKAVEGTAKVIGNRAAIVALKEGEEHGVRDYESALSDDALDPKIKQLIGAELLPRTRAHIPVLERLLEQSTPGS